MRWAKISNKKSVYLSRVGEGKRCQNARSTEEPDYVEFCKLVWKVWVLFLCDGKSLESYNKGIQGEPISKFENIILMYRE